MTLTDGLGTRRGGRRARGRRTSPPPSPPRARPEPERVPTDPRLSRRRRAVRRARRRRALATAAVAGSLALALWLAFFSPLLAVTSVRLVGARHTSSAEVASAAGAMGDNILLLSTSEVEERVRALPWVARARASRRLPGTVEVRVVERRPAAVLVGRGGRVTLDAGGRVLVQGAARPGLPVIAGTGVHPPAPGEDARMPAVRAALRALAALPRELRRATRAVLAPSAGRVDLALEGGTVARLGGATRLRAKVAVVRALLDQLRRTGTAAAYVDVRVPESPAVGPPPGASARG